LETTVSWSLDDIPWHRFDAAKVDPEIVKLAKAAALVEFNGQYYAHYLENIFRDDPPFRAAAREWAAEEVRHGEALARWAGLADPEFAFGEAVERFRAGYRIDLGVTKSVRGSRAGELVARCVVETGTSSYYSALCEATDEPVLKDVCRRIAADEFRHYKFFYKHLGRHVASDRLGRLKRFRVVAGRLAESGDDELAYAYYAANHPSEPYDRRRFRRAYAKRAYALYRPGHVERGVAMALKAAGLQPNGVLARLLAKIAYWFLRRQAKILALAGA
jgi:rubrerythrin